MLFAIYMVFLVVLIIGSLSALFWFVMNEDLNLSVKVFAMLIFATPLALQFFDPLPDKVHFAIPWTIQVAFIVWWAILYDKEAA